MGFLPSLVRSSLFGKARKTAQHPILLPWEDIAQCPQFAILKDTVDVVAHPVLDEGCQNGMASLPLVVSRYRISRGFWEPTLRSTNSSSRRSRMRESVPVKSRVDGGTRTVGSGSFSFLHRGEGKFPSVGRDLPFLPKCVRIDPRVTAPTTMPVYFCPLNSFNASYLMAYVPGTRDPSPLRERSMKVLVGQAPMPTQRFPFGAEGRPESQVQSCPLGRRNVRPVGECGGQDSNLGTPTGLGPESRSIGGTGPMSGTRQAPLPDPDSEPLL